MKIFINYRREDASEIAFVIAKSLIAEFGEANVFFDREGIKVGDNFVEKIESAFEGCKIFIPIIGEKWSNILGQRKATGEKDFVLEEISYALKGKEIDIIPILLDDSSMPSKSFLPEDLHEFIEIQAFDFSTNPKRLPRDLKELNAEVNKKLKPENPRVRIPIPIPKRHIHYFKDRTTELSDLRNWIFNKNIRIIQICGRGGIGKTSLVIKTVLEIANNKSNELSFQTDEYKGIIFISLGEFCYRTPDRIIELISITMDWENALHVKEIWKQGETSIHDRLALLFRGPLSNHQCLIVLDNLESILDNENKILKEYNSLSQFIEAILEYDHLIKLIVTSRRGLSLPPNIVIAATDKWIQIDLEKGLPEEFAISLLREFDYNGQLEIKDAKEEVLQDIVRQCSYIPRTLEILVATLMQKSIWTLDTLLNNQKFFSNLIENPARELFESLSSEQERLVIKALAIYGKPVSKNAIRNILPAALPIDELLDNLFHKYVIKFDHGLFWLHPLDKQFAYNQIPERGTEYSRQILHKRAADFYKSIPNLPKDERSSLEDLIPMLDAIDQLILADQSDEAAGLFIVKEIGENLYWWGYFYLLKDICQQFLGTNISSKWKIKLQIYLGKIQRNLGNFEEAKKIYENALPYINDSVDNKSKISLYIALGDINYYLNNYNLSHSYHLKADQLLKEISEPLLQSENAGDTANLMGSAGKLKKAQELYEKAILFSRKAKNRIFEGIWNGGLGNLYISFYNNSSNIQDKERAISYFLNAIEISVETSDKRHESHWNGVLGKFFQELGELEKAEDHLRKALSIANRIGYGRGISAQSKWLSDVFIKRIQNSYRKQDYNIALKILNDYQHLVDEIDIDELRSLINVNGYSSLLYEELGNNNANSGNIEKAISDYTKCLELDPQNLGAALSRAEVQIWAGKIRDARASLESIQSNLEKTSDKIIHAWLMCHIQNLENRSFAKFSEIIEKNYSGDIQLNYDVKGIEYYLKKIDKTKLTDDQIANFDVIQKLIRKIG